MANSLSLSAQKEQIKGFLVVSNHYSSHYTIKSFFVNTGFQK